MTVDKTNMDIVGRPGGWAAVLRDVAGETASLEAAGVNDCLRTRRRETHVVNRNDGRAWKKDASRFIIATL